MIMKIVLTEDALLIDLISKILEYSPIKRYTALDALKHAYFDELH
jgi:serine/threonine protein kinase